MGRWSCLGLMNLLLWCAPQLSRVSILFCPESPQGAPLGVAAMTEDLMAGSLFITILSSLRVHCWRWLLWLMAWWPQHPLFTGLEDNLFCLHPKPLVSTLGSCVTAGQCYYYWACVFSPSVCEHVTWSTPKLFTSPVFSKVWLAHLQEVE